LFSNDPLYTLTCLSDPNFPALDQVILANPKPAEVGAGLRPAPTVLAREGKVEMLENTPNLVTLGAELARPGYVVLLDRYDPNWQASVDGQETPVFRADHMFRAVHVEAGKHEIRFFYREKWLGTGLAVSLVTVFLLVVLYVKKSKDPEPAVCGKGRV